MSQSTEHIFDNLRNLYGDEIVAADVRGYCASNDISYQTIAKRLEGFKVGRGKWNLTLQQKLEKSYQAPPAISAVEQNLIPAKDDTFVSFGNFADIKKIIKSNLFYPTFITGLSGNGKTFGVEQACAALGRELIRVNITVETERSSY